LGGRVKPGRTPGFEARWNKTAWENRPHRNERTMGQEGGRLKGWGKAMTSPLPKPKNCLVGKGGRGEGLGKGGCGGGWYAGFGIAAIIPLNWEKQAEGGGSTMQRGKWGEPSPQWSGEKTDQYFMKPCWNTWGKGGETKRRGGGYVRKSRREIGWPFPKNLRP